MQAIYPSPEEPGTEMSFEEVWALNRGWLDQPWGDDEPVESDYPENDENSPPLSDDRFDAKLVVQHNVVTLDENGRLPDQHRGGKKKKKMEVNETQISESGLSNDMTQDTNIEQSKQSWTRRLVPRK